MEREERFAEDLMWLLRHRVRRRILMTVGDAGKISATSLRDQLGISTGSLYYNLKQLERLIQQDSKRNYVLTEEGEAVYKLLKERGDITAELVKMRKSRAESILSSIFFPIWLIGPLIERAQIALPAGIVSVLFISALFINFKMDLFLLNITHRTSRVLTDYAFMIGLSILIIYLYTSALSLLHDILTHQHGMEEGRLRPRDVLLDIVTVGGNGAKLLAAVMIGLLPMSIYPAAAFVDRVLGGRSFVVNDSFPAAPLPNLILVIAQIGSFILLTAGLAYIKKMRWHTAAIITFSLIYLSIIAQYFIR